MPEKDPSHRALAVTGNNIACHFEEKQKRSAQEIELMILAAHSARKFWEIAGTWLQVERAEHRLAKVYVAANDGTRAIEHARNCIQICSLNEAPALKKFFASESLATAQNAVGAVTELKEVIGEMETYFQALTNDEQSWCRAKLEKIKAAV